jgi:uncharacterized protein YukE
MVLTPDSAALPANWDSAIISVDPNTMSSVAQAVLASSTNINNDLGGIINSLSSLPLSWTGGSAALADEFNTRWSAATTALYGPPGDPGAGILNVITQGLAEAAQNYSKGEGSVKAMFSQFSQGAAGSSAVGGIAPELSAQPTTDTVTNNVYHTTSVDETFGGG